MLKRNTPVKLVSCSETIDLLGRKQLLLGGVSFSSPKKTQIVSRGIVVYGALSSRAAAAATALAVNIALLRAVELRKLVAYPKFMCGGHRRSSVIAETICCPVTPMGSGNVDVATQGKGCRRRRLNAINIAGDGRVLAGSVGSQPVTAKHRTVVQPSFT